jgi:hypothetical protein
MCLAVVATRPLTTVASATPLSAGVPVVSASSIQNVRLKTTGEQGNYRLVTSGRVQQARAPRPISSDRLRGRGVDVMAADALKRSDVVRGRAMMLSAPGPGIATPRCSSLNFVWLIWLNFPDETLAAKARALVHLDPRPRRFPLCPRIGPRQRDAGG